jgi:hypothetical protein
MVLLKDGLFPDVVPKFDFVHYLCTLDFAFFGVLHLMRYHLFNLFAIIDGKKNLIIEIAAMWLNVLINPVECSSNN